MSPSPTPAATHGGPIASLQFLCPRCEELFLYPFPEGEAVRGTLVCPHCSLELRSGAEPPRTGAPVERCWVCGNDAFYVQKDFNRELGFLIVAASAILILLVMLLIDHLLGIACLLAIAVVDWLVYWRLANVTVCYLCQSIYRGFPLGSSHRGFYLGLEEKHKKLRQKWLAEQIGEGR
jgi:hypothetical protein